MSEETSDALRTRFDRDGYVKISPLFDGDEN